MKNIELNQQNINIAANLEVTDFDELTQKIQEKVICEFCHTQISKNDTKSLNRIPSNVRELKNTDYLVLKCPNCCSIHSLTSVNLDEIYQNYPIQKQKMDFFTRQLFRKRLNLLKKAGLTKNVSILDYGCGSGLFVKYLNEHGYVASGFDPYSNTYQDKSILSQKYDWIISQDVIEHLTDPNDFLKNIQILLHPHGTLVIGTPNADRINLFNKIDQVGPLHQPFHRHIYSEKQIKLALAEAELSVHSVHLDWYVDTLFPFVNSAFLYRLFLSGDGTIERGFEPVSILDFIKNPKLIFYGLFGYFYSRKTDMLIFAKKMS